MLNVNKFKAKVVERGFKIPEVAKKVGINASTMYRKLNTKGSTFTVREVQELSKVLNLNRDEFMSIFFDEGVA